MEDQAVYGPRRAKRKPLILLLVLLLMAAVGTSAFLFTKYQQVVNENGHKEAASIVDRINELVILPSEKPAVSTVLDKAKLTNSVLKERAENGDKLLIYAKTKRIILYRPASGKVVDMLTIQDQADYTDTQDN
jgi:hypothetical protein